MIRSVASEAYERKLGASMSFLPKEKCTSWIENQRNDFGSKKTTPPNPDPTWGQEDVGNL